MKKKTRKLSVIALLLSTAVFTACSAPVSTNATSSKGSFNGKEIEAFADPIFAQKMKEYNVNGSNFVVVKDGKVLVNKGYGYADKEKKTLVDKNTVFQIASVSKTFTALAALQLVEQGKMNLDHDINAYLGGMKVPNETETPLTLRNMLSYTTGFDYPDKANFVAPGICRSGHPHEKVYDGAYADCRSDAG